MCRNNPHKHLTSKTEKVKQAIGWLVTNQPTIDIYLKSIQLATIKHGKGKLFHILASEGRNMLQILTHWKLKFLYLYEL